MAHLELGRLDALSGFGDRLVLGVPFKSASSLVLVRRRGARPMDYGFGYSVAVWRRNDRSLHSSEKGCRS